jgi:hypothetical protein
MEAGWFPTLEKQAAQTFRTKRTDSTMLLTRRRCIFVSFCGFFLLLRCA